MPTTAEILETMRKKGMSEDIIAQFPAANGDAPDPIVPFFDQMDELLSEDERLDIMQEQGCYKVGEADEMNRAFDRAHAGKSVEERIALLDEKTVHPCVPCRVNGDGTLTVYWEIGEAGKYQCVCERYHQLKEEQPKLGDITKTYCGCCGGHIRYHYQISSASS